MDLLAKAKVVRLLTNDGKYLIACEDTKTVSLQTKGPTNQQPKANANWTVEHIQNHAGQQKLELWSCYNKTLQITSMMGTVRQMKKGKQSWFPGWEVKSSISSRGNNTFRLWTCKCFLEARPSLKLIYESYDANCYDKDYRLDWFVEVVESIDDFHPQQSVQEQQVPVAVGAKTVPTTTDQVVAPIRYAPQLSMKDQCPCNQNSVVVNYHVDSGRWAPGPMSYFNSGQNVNGSGIQKNGDVNVKYDITTGRDINVSFK